MANEFNEAELIELKRTRTNLKSKFTRFVTFINNAANKDKFNEIKVRLLGVENALNEFESIQMKIDILTDETEPGTEISEFESIYYLNISKAREILNSSELANPTTSTSIRPGSQITNVAQSQLLGQDSIRLPKLDLPSFSGAYQDWLNFYDSFKALIHDNSKLADIQKLQYLRSCLKDEASKVISSLETSSTNYNVAWNLLNDRYDNRRIIIQNHIKMLMELPIFNKESATNIRQLIDNFQMHIRALAALNESVEHWDSILIYVLTSKLDRNTHREWEKSLTGKNMPKLQALLEFLRNRYQVLEASTFDTTPKNQGHSQNTHHSKKQSLSVTQSKSFCNFCKGDHKIFGCNKFQVMTVTERRDFVKSSGLCFNCLRKGHRSCDCKLSHCKKCSQKHHTLLHLEDNTNSEQPSQSLQMSEQSQGNSSKLPSQMLQACVQSQVLLSTAIIYIHDKNDKQFRARVVLDSGSQSNFITEKFAELLNLDRENINMPVEGLNQLETRIKHSVTTQVKSMQTEFAAKLDFLVIPRICNSLPLEYINRNQIQIDRNIRLADPEFHIPAEVDALLGAEIFYELISVGRIKLSKQSASLQKTKLGWIISGKILQTIENKRTRCHLSLDNINNQIKRLWEIEELTVQKFLSPEESYVEKHFKDNVKREPNGKYTVKVPVNEKIHKLGNSYKSAEYRFFALEKKFESNETLRNEYCKFMREYVELGHMTRLKNNEPHDKGYFLPHHAIIKETSTTTKVRVVFDGSAKSSSGISLNDALMVGPTIQQSLLDILIRSRTHQILLSADIEKMYRMINLDKNDTKFQRIIWRDDPNKKLEIYELNTVTYGTASAPYLATRVLQELAENEKEKFPKASKIVKRDFFVDDLFTGKKNRKEAISLRDDLIDLLKIGGFNLRQWCSNDLEIISSLPENLINIKLFSDPSLSIKTLGIQWNPRTDELIYTIDNMSNNTRITKRTMLSQIAQLLYDLIGLLGPVIIKAKIFMQRLWRLKCDWDETVPPDIHTDWQIYRQELNCLNNLSFPRRVVINEATNVELHGFCDASEAAYGACIYVRSRNKNDNILVNLLCSKTRVAPLKSLTIPRLELCAALLLAKLLQSVKSILALKIDRVYLWSDSTITLQWINTEPYLLKTFVANRVSQIRELTDPFDWDHITTDQNVADPISRGQMPREFMQNSIWVTGPTWLSENENHWPRKQFDKNPDLELKGNVALITNEIKTNDSNCILNKFSSLTKTKRVMAFCMRFIGNIKAKLSSKNQDNSLSISNSNSNVKELHLSIEEIQIAMNKILIFLQKLFFSREINALLKKVDLHRSSNLLSLNPFLDKTGLLRVGGRLKNSILSYNERYPIVLPKSHHITNLIIKFEHEINYHSGAQATLNAVRSNYWPINMSSVKNIIKKCMTCFRAKPTNQNYLMGNLPRERITQSRPFIITGVDYCGPFYIKERKHRNRSKVKAYIAIFVCFATKACHIELVTDLTTETFLGCLKRFFARRGKSSCIFSDNGTNFVGANNELNKTLRELLNSENHNTEVLKFLEKQGISWKFSPPNSPHFGGLWEAAVKSFKYLFIRSIGDKLFTFEELSTFTTEIEAILNSRPITPLSSDPNDLRALSPSHFLIGDSLMSVPEHDLSEIPENRLSNWQNIQRVKQCFWKRWYKEYLNQLNIRCKWQQSSGKNPEIGTMVIVREDNIPPLRWHLGRIIEIHPGDDSIVRVVTVRTSTGIYKRSVKRIVPLPIQ